MVDHVVMVQWLRHHSAGKMVMCLSPNNNQTYLSEVETQARGEYVAEALQQGLISGSTLPASTGFFFVEKKDSGLRPCINY